MRVIAMALALLVLGCGSPRFEDLDASVEADATAAVLDASGGSDAVVARDIGTADAGFTDDVGPPDVGFKVRSTNLVPAGSRGSSSLYRIRGGLHSNAPSRSSSGRYRMRGRFVPTAPSRR